MTTGPQRKRLDVALTEAGSDAVDRAGLDWGRAALALDLVAQRLELRADNVRRTNSGLTIDAASSAFRRSAEAMHQKSDELKEGARALRDAAGAIEEAWQTRDRFADLSAPSAPTRTPGPSTPAELSEMAQHRKAVAAYDRAAAAQEEASREAADEMDRRFSAGVETMRSIHGGPDPAGAAGSSSAGGEAADGGSSSDGSWPAASSSSALGGADHGGPSRTVQVDGPRGGPGTGPGMQLGNGSGADAAPSTGPIGGPGSDQPGPEPIEIDLADGAEVHAGAPVEVGGVAGGTSSSAVVIGAVAAGGLLGAGGLVAAGVRGVTPSPATGAQAVRPIGASTRAGGPGVLGRSSAAPGSPTTRPAGSRSSARPGTGSAAGRRGQRKEDDDERDEPGAWEDPDAWLDGEEGHGPLITRATGPSASEGAPDASTEPTRSAGPERPRPSERL